MLGLVLLTVSPVAHVEDVGSHDFNEIVSVLIILRKIIVRWLKNVVLKRLAKCTGDVY